MRRLLLSPGLLGAAVFLTLGCLILPYPGIQTDEALFGAPLWKPEWSQDSFMAFKHRVPTMIMSYVGALKTWIYAPVFQVWTPSPWSIRLPMVIAGAVTIWLFARFLEQLLGRRAAWLGTALLATDVSHVLTTTFDWGPVALQHLLLAGAGVLLVGFRSRGGAWRLAAASFLFGLALWNKAIVLWTFGGLGIALLVAGWPVLRRHLTFRHLAVAAFFFAAGCSLFIRYNVRHPAASFAGNATVAWANVAGKEIFIQGLLDGSNVLGYLVVDPGAPVRLTFGPWLFGLALLLAFVLPRRVALFPVVAAAATWFVMAATKGAGGAAHHAVLLYPLPQWMAAAALTHPKLERWKAFRIAAALAVALLAADNLRLHAVHLDYAQRYGSPHAWSDAIYALPDRIRQYQPSLVVQHDWGLQDNLILLSATDLPLRHPGRPFPPEEFDVPADAVWTGYTPAYEVFAGINQELVDAAAGAGYEKVLLEVIRDRQGHEVIELFRFRKKALDLGAPGH